jgi:hypothetical protein
MNEVSVLRLNLLRACYLLLAAGTAVTFMSQLPVAAALPLMEGAVCSLLSALGLLSIIGLVSPLRMLPLLLFEIGWKLLWTGFVAMPRWRAGTIDEGTLETLFAVAWVLPFLFIVPWHYALRTYFRPEPWRHARAVTTA